MTFLIEAETFSHLLHLAAIIVVVAVPEAWKLINSIFKVSHNELTAPFSAISLPPFPSVWRLEWSTKYSVWSRKSIHWVFLEQVASAISHIKRGVQVLHTLVVRILTPG